LTENDRKSLLTKVGRLPPVLRAQARWLRWELQQNAQGRLTKVPDCSTRSPSALRSLADVLTGPMSKDQGIGMALTGGVKVSDGWLVAWDVDGCRAPATGALEPWAEELWTTYGRTYAEVTPSGTGIRIWLITRVLPELGRTKVPLDYQRPPGVPEFKSVELQLFGYGVAQYVTVSAEPLEGASEEVLVVDSLDWAVDTYGMRPDQTGRPAVSLPVGYGEVPELGEVEEAVKSSPHGAAFLRGEWPLMVNQDKDKSASAAYYRGAQTVLRAARNHAAVAVRFLLERTAWGRGHVDDSADPYKYTREDWVAAEVARVAGKAPAPDPTEGFGEFDAEGWQPPASYVEAERAQLIIPTDRFLAERDRERFLVYNLIPAVGLVQFYGAPACGKTPLAMSLAIHVATDRPSWFGHPIDRHGDVLYLIGEDRSGIRDRLQAELEVMGIDPADCRLKFGARPGRLTEPADVVVWGEAIKEHCPDGLAMLVVDTQVTNLGDADENDTKDMSRFVDHIRKITAGLRCVCLSVHHSGVSNKDRARGSSVVNAAADGVWRVTRPSNHAVVAISEKEKNWTKPDPLEGTLEVRKVDTDSRGRDITAVTLRTTAMDPAEVFDDLPDADPVRTLMGVVAELDGKEVTQTEVARMCDMTPGGSQFKEAVRRAVSMDLVDKETNRKSHRTVFTLTDLGRETWSREGVRGGETSSQDDSLEDFL
jgi:hypothetical protein